MEIPHKASDQETITTEGKRIALQLQPGLKWFDGALTGKGEVNALKLPYCLVSYFGMNRTEKHGTAGILTVPRKHHRVLMGVIPSGAPKHLIDAFPLILHTAALDLGAPDEDGAILQVVTPMTDAQCERLRLGAQETNAFCQWSLMWLEPGETWAKV